MSVGTARGWSAATILVVCAVGLAACGSDDSQPASSATATTTAAMTAATPPASSETTATTATTTTSETPPATTATTTTTTAPGEDDSGDEQPIRIPAAFTVRDGGAQITPATIEVLAYMPVEVSLTAIGAAATVTVSLPSGERTLDLRAGTPTRLSPVPLDPGRYAVRSAAGGSAALVSTSGDAVGP